MIAKISYSFPHLVEGFVEVELSLARVRHAGQRGRDERGVHQPEPRSLGRDGEGATTTTASFPTFESRRSNETPRKLLLHFFCWISF